ncbi:MAG: hypothetical protein ABEH64_04310 [Salinirussus sp.]
MTTPVDRVEKAMETELSRLGSEKLLLAATGADIRDATVAGVLAATLAVGAENCIAWADATDDSTLSALLMDAGECYREIRSETLEAWPDAEDSADPLVNPTDPGEDSRRIGIGLLGLPILLDRLLLQAVSYHVNEANTTAADRLREFRTSIRELSDGAADNLEDEAVEEPAVESAGAVIEAAYERYADRLEAMGLDPKPLC